MGFILNTSFQPTSGFLNLNVSTAPIGYSVAYAVVGGGGAGGGNFGGGGGAGQVIQSTTTLAFNTLYNIIIGQGAVGTTYDDNTNYQLQGGFSIFTGQIAYGGGLGGNGLSGYLNGNSGGSGGGAASGYSLSSPNTTSATGGSATSGYTGGNSIAPNGSGGGGGAGGAGGNGNLTVSGNGGAGFAIVLNGYSAGTFAGGGGGGGYNGYNLSAGTGTAGGGNGAATPNANGGNATANTGSGGGGNAGGGGGVGGNGGSGIVIVSIPTANYPGDAYVNGGVVDNTVWTKTTSGSNTILTFKKNSSYAASSTGTRNTYTITSLAVGGGGGGSDDNAIGGGSGGYVVPANITATTGNTYTINVGVGGINTQWDTNSSHNNVTQEAQNGTASTITLGVATIITANGGVSGVVNLSAGYGGGNVNPPTINSDTGSYINGGNGIISSITGTATYYAGGGGGYDQDVGETGTTGLGSIGAGGQGGVHANSAYSIAGSDGVVIFSIPVNYYTGKTTGNPVVTISGSNVILTYNHSGTYVA